MTYRNFKHNVHRDSKPRISTIVYRILLRQKNLGNLASVVFHSEDKFLIKKHDAANKKFGNNLRVLVLVVGNKQRHQIKKGDDYLFIPHGSKTHLKALSKPVLQAVGLS